MTEGSGGRIGVGMVGHAFMGAVHSHAWRTAHRFFDLPLTPELTSVAGRSPEAVSAAAERLGFASTETDWRRLVERAQIGGFHIVLVGVQLRVGPAGDHQGQAIVGFEQQAMADEAAAQSPARAVHEPTAHGAERAAV